MSRNISISILNCALSNIGTFLSPLKGDSNTWHFSYTNQAALHCPRIKLEFNFHDILLFFHAAFLISFFQRSTMHAQPPPVSLEGATTSVNEAAWDQIFQDIFHSRLGPFFEIPSRIPPIGPSEPKVFLELKEFRPCFVANSLFPSLQETWHLDLGHLNLTKYIATVLL